MIYQFLFYYDSRIIWRGSTFLILTDIILDATSDVTVMIAMVISIDNILFSISHPRIPQKARQVEVSESNVKYDTITPSIAPTRAIGT